MKRHLFFFLSLMGLSFLCARPVKAAVLFEDHFDRTELGSWQEVRNWQWVSNTQNCQWFGQAAHWRAQNNQIGIELQSNPCVTELAPLQFQLQPKQEYQVEFRMQMNESIDMDRAFTFAWQDVNNWYDLRLFGKQLVIQKVVDGQQYFLTSSEGNYNFLPDQSYVFKVIFQPGKTISVLVNNTPVINALDTTPVIANPTTIALKAGVGENPRAITWFDDVKVEDLDKNLLHLPVERMTQRDALWGLNEYDTGHLWSDQPTIERWGCALTSAAMLLRSYGLQTIQNGIALTPATLNDWLKSQADGYLGQGNVNWIAITRLTAEISKRLGTPKLEYLRHQLGAEGNLELARKEILANRPVIGEIVGHFFVGSGLQFSPLDLLITDPAYKFTNFSQHKEPLLSVRTFVPSHTDLSYFLFTLSPELQLEVFDPAGKKIPLTIFSDQLQASDDPTKKNLALRQTQIAKPISGTYTLKVTQATPGPFTIKVYTYGQEAKLTQLQETGVVGPAPVVLKLQYEKESSQARLTPEYNSNTFGQLMKFSQLPNSRSRQQLEKLAASTFRSSRGSRSQYVKQLKDFINHPSSGFTNKLRQILCHQLDYLQ